MHILHVIESLEFGGAEKVVVDLANGFADRARVSVCCLKTFGPLRATLTSQVDAFCLHKREGNDYGMPRQLAREIRKRAVDVVHTHNWGAFLEGMLAGRYADTPVRIHTVHGSYPKCRPGPIARGKRVVRHWAERRIAPLCQRIVGVSDSICADIEREIGLKSSALCTIHNGIDIYPHRERTTHSRTRFISVGRLAEIKNFPIMLAAFARLSEYRDADLTLVGDGPERGHLTTLAKELRIDHRVRFVGFSDQVAQYLSDADVFLVSSNYEGISIAVLEAMRASLPVVATKVGGIPETVIDEVTGILVPPGEAGALAAAMSRLDADRQLRERMGSAGYAVVAEKFSKPAMLSQYASLYRTLYPVTTAI